MISISYYINEFGYPKRRDFGKHSSVAWLVWIHNPHRELKRRTFQIILQGYLSGEIDESEVRSYFLRGLYTHKFDDNNYNTIALKDLFKICEVDVTEKISIKGILDAKDSIQNFEQIKTISESVWKSKDQRIVYEVNGEEFSRIDEGQKVKIFQKENGKMYLLKVHDDHSGEPIELEELAQNRYKFKVQDTEKYFIFFEDKISYMNGDILIKEYLKLQN